MHIPDGYLSPETCAVLYAASAPFWYVALRRVKKLLHTRFLPLISLFAAFSFVVMMFNLPLPGGTTGHAVGMGIAAIVLGPWASILAISTALAIQAFFFGDGGITALGANCFNMAIIGSLSAWCLYHLLAGNAPNTARRRVIAAGLAGYAAINLSALLAAIEFGIQPIFFHDAHGTPLYCPYPLSISVPAMMLGHLTFAGFAEFILTAGVVAYLQRADPALLGDSAAGQPRALRPLWLTLAALVLLTPLGIIAVGTAWGEWSPSDFAKAPAGLARLSNLWNAPIARYEPQFIRSASVGYIVAALIGVALILLVFLLLSRFRPGFIERTTGHLYEIAAHSLFAEEIARTRGLLQPVDPRLKLCCACLLLVAAISIRSWLPLLILLGLITALALLSHIPLSLLSKTVWFPALAFSGLIAIPALFLTPGPLLYAHITRPGFKTASLLLLRVEACATISAALIFTTSWSRLLRALRFFRIPVSAVMILGMAHRYLFLLLRTARDMFEARQSRLVGTLPRAERVRLTASAAGVLLSKTFELTTEVHAAMRSRGYHGETYLLDDPS
ncbi:MAG TPA: cobalt transporter CbiM [Bryobacteraceae bacterium]|jgi:cobalt/nickel transport system permease protein|nr:cobalt transporter CbiM [Bryobacteraceae bacterium]